MTKKPKVSTKDWRNLPIEKWNTTTFHAYLIDRNKDEYGVDYVPFGKGPISARWRTEQGQLKQSIDKYGAEVVLEFIELCFDGRKFNAKYPTLSYGFMYAFLRDNLARAEVHVKAETERKESAAESKADEVDDEWF